MEAAEELREAAAGTAPVPRRARETGFEHDAWRRILKQQQMHSTQRRLRREACAATGGEAARTSEGCAGSDAGRATRMRWKRSSAC